jgi:hypothetical protein
MPITHVLPPHLKELSPGFNVRRSLPAAAMQSIGPFLFFDHFGPIAARPGDNHDVRPHPHIGLATVTYLFEGAMDHRDSMGTFQRIEPGAINWMTAGSGIVHSERRPPDLADAAQRLQGLQLWAALPVADEECAPQFTHTPAASLPVWREGPVTARVLIGAAFGLESPVATFSETLYVDFEIAGAASVTLPPTRLERAIYIVSGTLEIDAVDVDPLQLVVLNPDQAVVIRTTEASRFVMIGGAPLDGYRYMWWNLVSSRKERIEQAKEDWRLQRMGSVTGETEFIPLPER